MIKSNGGIIGPDNVTTGGFNGVASGVFKLGEVTDLIRQSKWPEPSPFTNTVPNSVRFNSGSSDYLTKSFSTTGNRQKFTLSMWFKRGVVPTGNQSGTERMLFQAYQDSSNQDQIWLQSNGTINYVRNNANAVTPSQVLSDPNAWYHVVFAGDTTQGSNADRLKVYVNGTQAPIAQGDTIAQNSNFGAINNAQSYTFGKRNSNDWYFDGYMAETIMVDGQQLAPTSFGVANSDGVWTPIPYSGTFGTNGFNLQFENAAALGTDSSSNGNTFTVNNLTSLDQSTDYPEVNFSTLNPLVLIGNTGRTYADGNLTFNASSNNWTATHSTIGASRGKWYAEFKVVTLASSTGYGNLGLMGTEGITNGNFLDNANSVGTGLDYRGSAQVALYSGASTVQNAGVAFAAGAIVGLAVDMDNKKFYLSQNGTYLTVGGNVGNPTSGSTGTGSLAIPAGIETFLFGLGGYSTSFKGTWNFGSPSYAISSGNADANGYGNFEYAVPSGYYSLNTKNLGEFG